MIEQVLSRGKELVRLLNEAGRPSISCSRASQTKLNISQIDGEFASTGNKHLGLQVTTLMFYGNICEEVLSDTPPLNIFPNHPAVKLGAKG